MVELSEKARKGLDDYLRQVRSYLRWSKSLDRNEVEQNIAEHIERELEDAPEPVSASVLESVLARLGSPRQWVPPEALNWWGKLILKLRTDSEDWRLAYISFFLLLIGVLLMFLVSPLQVVFLAASFITARAALAASGDEDLGAQKWLLYPSLLIVYAIISATVLGGPGLLAGIGGAELHEIPEIREGSNMGSAAFAFSSATLATGIWWMVLGLISCKWPGLVRQPLHPFAAPFNRRRALAISGAGLLLLIAGFVPLYMYDAFAIFTSWR
jgi:HAAS